MDSNFKKIPANQRRQLEMYFQTQGSFIMDTIIKPIIEDFDLDDGVYFQGNQSPEERPAPQIFHDWVINAVDKDNDYEKVTDKPTCVRVRPCKDCDVLCAAGYGWKYVDRAHKSA